MKIGTYKTRYKRALKRLHRLDQIIRVTRIHGGRRGVHVSFVSKPEGAANMVVTDPAGDVRAMASAMGRELMRALCIVNGQEYKSRDQGPCDEDEWEEMPDE